VENWKTTQQEVAELREGQTDPEIEESAQADPLEYTLEQVSQNQLHELTQIDAALRRMDTGTYGECVECGEEISIERLEALPYALLDSDCALRREKQRWGVLRTPTL
jgi:DnaK suppressor protein